MSAGRDIAGWCEQHPHDIRRGCSTVWFPASRAKCDHNQVVLAAALVWAAMEARSG